MLRPVALGLAVVLAGSTGFAQQNGATGTGALLRGMDKISGDVVDFELASSQTKQLGRIQVTLGECRYPAAAPTSDAFAYLEINNAGSDEKIFTGWMIASSPALNALDHARYDIWVLRCTTS